MKGLYEDDQPTGVWTNRVADSEGQHCVWCNQKIPRHHPTVVSEDGRVMHRDCFEDQPTGVHNIEDFD